MKKIICLLVLISGTAFSAGVTIITHGYNPSVSGVPAWMASMRDDIAAEWLGNEQNYATITITGTLGNLSAACSPWNVGLASSSTGEIIVLIDWSAVADHLITGIPAQDVAAAVLPGITQGQSGQRPLAELPIHLIGHSRGGGLVCEIARLLGEQGVIVDHVTPLDVHPLTASDPQPIFSPNIIDTPAAIYQNVIFADGYLQQISYPGGQPLAGAYDRQWTVIPGGYHNNASPGNTYADHRNIILAYHATVKLASPLNNGEATLLGTDRASWFTVYETDGGTPGQKAGFHYSRMAGREDRDSSDQPNGAERPIDGFHNDALFGGAGTRTALSWASAVWPNLAQVEVRRGSTTLGPGAVSITIGESLTIHFVGLDADSGSNVTFYVDQDRNPYNGNNLATIGTQSVSSAGTAFYQGTQTWDTTGLTLTGSGYIYGAITDGTHTRYLYAVPVFNAASSVFDWTLLQQ